MNYERNGIGVEVLWVPNNDGEHIVQKTDGSYEPVAFVTTGKDDANLVADAINVANETGLTPRQLLEQRDELLVAVKEYDEAFTDFDPSISLSRHRIRLAAIKAREAIAKAKGETE